MLEEFETLLEKAARLITDARRIVVFTGAGISTESGIPDFRSPGGLWSKYDPDEFTYQKLLNSPEVMVKHWKMLKETFMKYEAAPNLAHYAIAELEKMGKLDCVITQNVDDLHQRAGVPREKVFELHGNMKWVKCLNCGKRYPMEEIKKRVEGGVELPDCDDCHGILKPDGVFFGEALPQDVLNAAIWHSRNCDLCIVIGSSVVVYPAALMPQYARQSGAKLIIVNRDPTDLDRAAEVCLHEAAGKSMSQIIERVKERLKPSE